jgi:hypothetical protein
LKLNANFRDFYRRNLLAFFWALMELGDFVEVRVTLRVRGK